MNFKSQNNEMYNTDFNLDGLAKGIQLSHDSATSPDEIHYQMFKHFPEKNLLKPYWMYFITFGQLVNFHKIGHMQQ